MYVKNAPDSKNPPRGTRGGQRLVLALVLRGRFLPETPEAQRLSAVTFAIPTKAKRRGKSTHDDVISRPKCNFATNKEPKLTETTKVEAVEAVGRPFDPHRHEALGHQDSVEYPEGHVLSQMRKGYKLKDRLLRPASVFVARKPGTH